MAIGEWKVEREERQTWIDFLKDEDLVFAKRFLLASGSLKALAQAYGVTYPTIRLRLDRLIQKINLVEDERIDSDFERLARVQYAEGKIDLDTLKLLLNAHRKELEKRHENPAVR